MLLGLNVILSRRGPVQVVGDDDAFPEQAILDEPVLGGREHMAADVDLIVLVKDDGEHVCNRPFHLASGKHATR